MHSKDTHLMMEEFILPLRPFYTETLEIILYQNERKGRFKFSKEIKRIRCPLDEMGDKNIDGIKFTLAKNDPNISFPKHPPVIYNRRYAHIYVDRCINLPIKDIFGLSDPFVKVSLNKNKKKDLVILLVLY